MNLTNEQMELLRVLNLPDIDRVNPFYSVNKYTNTLDDFDLFNKTLWGLQEKSLLDENLQLTDYGQHVYKENLSELMRAKERQELEIRKLKVDLANAERVYRSYPITRTAAWIGAISGIVLLIQKLIEWYSILH